MHILILDNDHLPELVGDSLHKETLKKPADNRESYDVWVSRELSRIFENESYDMIVLPYSLSNENYMDYSGLRIAAHIRLTEEWQHSRRPILFLGCESPDFVARFSSLGDILFTPYIFTSRDSLQSLDKWENYINNSFNPDMTEQQYCSFLDKIQVAPPENYGSHHTIANEWAVQRWSDMLQHPIENENQDFKSLLFFKYLRSKLGSPQRFNSKWWKNHPNLTKVNLAEGEYYKIVYIDDEYFKGWGQLLSYVVTSAGLSAPAIFTGFENEITRDELISRIKAFIDANDADCYILDLRLHESDFSLDTKSEDLTGHEIAKYIKSKNKANQIVIFTASNKVWNLKEDIMKIGAAGYVIKESPEMVYDREQTYRNFQDFQREVLHACRQSYIKNYVCFLKNKHCYSLDSFIDLLLLDKTEKKDKVLSTLLLNLVVFIETFVKSNFEFLDEENLYRIGSSERIVNIDKKMRFHGVKNSKGFTSILEVSCSDCQTRIDDKYNHYLLAKNDKGNQRDITIILAALKYYYKFSDADLNLVLRAKNQRNEHIAHNGNAIDMRIEDIRYIFEHIIKRMLDMD